jgi:hypothetical protein
MSARISFYRAVLDRKGLPIEASDNEKDSIRSAPAEEGRVRRK